MSLGRNKIEKIVGILLIALIFLSSIGLLLEGRAGMKESVTISSSAEPMTHMLTSHAPIRIDSDADFDEAHGISGGSGSSSDPYIIEKLEIDSYGNGPGIYIGNTTAYFIVRNCTLYNASYHSWPYYEGAGILLYSTHNGFIYNNTLSYNEWAGILIYEGSDNTVSGNLLKNNNIGVNLNDCTNCNVSSNVFINSTDSIYILSSYNNKIYKNNISSSSNSGIQMLGAEYCTVSENEISNSNIAIILSLSTDITLSKNSFFSCGVLIDGDEIDMWNSHEIDSQNTINGKPIYYLKNQRTSYSIPRNAGQVILANCKEIKIKGLNITNASVGIEIAFSQSCYISNSLVSNNSIEGIDVYNSNNINIHNNILSNNTRTALSIETSISCLIFNNSFIHGGIFLNGDYLEHWNTHEIASSNTLNGKPIYYLKNKTDSIVKPDAGEVILANCTNISIKHQNLLDGDVGIDMAYSDDCIIYGNNISSNNDIGIHSDTCNNNTIFNNTIAVNTLYGLYLFHSNNNRIYHNDFFSNGEQARDDSFNMWNFSYPIGGNYWSDYDGHDEYSGDSYRVDGSDGIGDEPYNSTGIIDYYPLASRYRSKPHITIYSPSLHSLFNTSNVSMEWSGKAIGSDIDSYEVRIDGDNWTYMGEETTYQFPNLADGRHSAYVKVIDGKGHITTACTDFVVDLLPPQIIISSPTKNSSLNHRNLTVYWKAYDNASGIYGYKIRLDNGFWKTVPPSSTEYSFFNLSEGSHTVYVEARDNVGRETIETVAFNIDRIPPRIVSLFPFENQTGINISQNITITFSEPISPENFSYSCSPNLFLRSISWNENTTTVTISHSDFDYGTIYIVTITRADDLAGNSIKPYSWSFTTTDIGTITGRVIDNRGNPIVGATVSLDTGELASTDENGEFSIQAHAGSHKMTISKEGYETKSKNVFVSPGDSTDILSMELSKSQILTGAVLWISLLLLSIIVIFSGVALLTLKKKSLAHKTKGKIENREDSSEEIS